VVGRPDLAAAGDLATAAGRRAAEDRIEAVIAAWTRQRLPDEAMTALQARRVPAGVARSFEDLMLREPHLEARGFWQEVERPFLGRHRQPSPTFREEGRAYPIRHAAPTLGQSTRDVLRRILDLPEAELDRLEAARIIGTEPIPSASAGRAARPCSIAAARDAGQGR
jgi:crotonobetainyl-CoA:carnitine CoA-transferase CaiB-like acyl-CoA transferase